MPAKVTAQAGNITDQATWTGGLPAPGDTCTLMHACTLADGNHFDVGAGSLEMAGAVGSGLTASGVCAITATGGVTGIERLEGPAAAPNLLTITGDCATTADVGWQYTAGPTSFIGRVKIVGTLYCGGSGIGGVAGDGALCLTTGDYLAVSGGVTAETGSLSEGVHFEGGGEIVGDVEVPEASGDAALEFGGGGKITGNVIAASTTAPMGIYFVSGGMIDGDADATGAIYGLVIENLGTVTGTASGTGGAPGQEVNFYDGASFTPFPSPFAGGLCIGMVADVLALQNAIDIAEVNTHLDVIRAGETVLTGAEAGEYLPAIGPYPTSDTAMGPYPISNASVGPYPVN